jgi:oligopeptide transport system substrate-binding protein
MSLRTRRSAALLASLMLLAVACTGATPTTAPATSSTATTPPASTGQATTPPASTSGETTPPASGETTPPSSTEPSAGPPGEGGVLRIYCCATDPRSLRPQAASGSDEISILGGIQRGLLYYNQDLTLRPELATDMPTVSDDGLEYTFTLGDHNYSDGTPIVADDYVRAVRSLADPRNAFDYGYEACWIAGVDDILGADFGCSTDAAAMALPADPAQYFTGTPEDQAIDAALETIGVEAVDDHTVKYTLKTPTSFFTNLTAMWLFSPVPESQTSWAEAADIVSSGPFMIQSWTHNAQMVLVPNPEWTGATTPSLSSIELSIGGDPAAAVAAWERGDLDEVVIPSSDVRRVLDTPDYADMINRGTTLSIEYYDFANCVAEDEDGNVLCPPNAAVGNDARVPGGSPSQNANFRKALTQAVDRAEMIQVGFAGLGTVSYSPTMPGIPGFPTITDENNPFPFDVAAALASMSTALDELGIGQPDPADADGDGIPDAVNALMVVSDPPAATDCDQTCATTKARVQLLAPLKFGYNCDAGHDQRVLYLANVWRTNLGFTGQQMDIRCTDFGTFRTERRAGNVYDIARNGWGADFPHPDNQNRDLFACGAGNNNSKYCNPDYDDLLNQGAAAADYAAAEPFYHQAEELLAQDAPVIFLRYGEGVRLIRPWVTGLVQTSNDHQNPGDVFYETISIAPH